MYKLPIKDTLQGVEHTADVDSSGVGVGNSFPEGKIFRNVR